MAAIDFAERLCRAIPGEGRRQEANFIDTPKLVM